MPLYEFGIDPLLRFFHDRDIQPAHWIRINKRNLIPWNGSKLNTKFAFRVDASAIHPLASPPCEIPWVVASFDIECVSSHGDFPQAMKDWKKPARDLVEYVSAMKSSEVWSRR